MRLIDADILERSLTEIDEHINMDIFTNEVRELIDNAPTVEAIPKNQYEARLKADMVAMLTELQSKVREVIMNNCLCESCCDKDYCLIYQDYKNPDGIVAEPITACGRYKKLHTVEDTYTKEEVIDMFNELRGEIDETIKSNK